MWRVWSAGFNQGVLDVASITTDPATRAELTTGLLRAMDGGPSEDDSTEEGGARQRAAAAPAAAPDLVDQVVSNARTVAMARNAQGAQQEQQAAAAAAALGADRLELQAGARWLEDSLPFVVLLLLVFLQQHIFGIGAFCWLSTVLHNANARIRTQVLLKEQRDSLAVLSLASLLFSQMCMVVMLCGASKLRAQLALRPEHDGRQASSIFELLWAVLVSDLMVRRAARRRAVRAAPLLLPPPPRRTRHTRRRARLSVLPPPSQVRYGTMLLKVVLTLVCPAAAFRRLRRVFSLLESAGLCYRSLLPMPLWYEWLLRSVQVTRHPPPPSRPAPVSAPPCSARHAERRAAAASCSQGRLFASLLTGLYLTFKLAALVERLRATLAMGRSLLLHQPPFGKYATTEAVLEAGDEVRHDRRPSATGHSSRATSRSLLTSGPTHHHGPSTDHRCAPSARSTCRAPSSSTAAHISSARSASLRGVSGAPTRRARSAERRWRRRWARTPTAPPACCPKSSDEKF